MTMNKQIKAISDLKQVLGEKLAVAFLNHIKAERAERGSCKLKRVPYSVGFHASKPAMYLGDYDTLTAYLVNLDTLQVERSHYCGSFDTAMNHPEQGATGSVPKGYAVFMVTVHGGSGNLSWSIDVISSDLVAQLPSADVVSYV